MIRSPCRVPFFSQHNFVFIPDCTQSITDVQVCGLVSDLSWPLYFTHFPSCCMPGSRVSIIPSTWFVGALISTTQWRCLGEKEVWNPISRISLRIFVKLSRLGTGGFGWACRGAAIPCVLSSEAWELSPPLTCADSLLHKPVSFHLLTVWDVLLL